MRPGVGWTGDFAWKERMNELALFAGAGGGILGGHLLGWRCVCAVEIDEYARQVLIERQNDGCLRPFPIWDDITTFDGKPWSGLVDVVTGGFPCQDISCAGGGGGIEAARSGLWKHMARVVGEVRPQYVFVENSPLLVSRGLAVVLGDLASMGYDAVWGVVGAHHAGAPHKRDRIWILAHASGVRGTGQQRVMVGASKSGQRREDSEAHGVPWTSGDPADRKSGVEPKLGRVADGVAHRVDRLRCIGNGQVPAVVRLAWETLNQIKP
jgi:DNA (cytosine-5)-methyltransferase 1